MKLYTNFWEIIKTFNKYNKENHIIFGMKTEVPEISAIIVYKQYGFNCHSDGYTASLKGISPNEEYP